MGEWRERVHTTHLSSDWTRPYCPLPSIPSAAFKTLHIWGATVTPLWRSPRRLGPPMPPRSETDRREGSVVAGHEWRGSFR